MECGNSFISVRIAGYERKLYDATDDPGFVLSLMDIITGSVEIKLPGIVIRGEMNKFPRFPAGIDRKAKKVTTEQSNTSVVIGNELILKIYRKLIDSDNPDVIIPTMLWQNTDFRDLPMPIGKLELAGQNKLLLASLSQYLSDSIDGWSRFVTYLREGVKSGGSAERLLLLEDAEKLGSLTGRMHIAL
ncbi:pep2 protein, partial [mine drainage metagenome]